MYSHHVGGSASRIMGGVFMWDSSSTIINWVDVVYFGIYSSRLQSADIPRQAVIDICWTIKNIAHDKCIVSDK